MSPTQSAVTRYMNTLLEHQDIVLFSGANDSSSPADPQTALREFIISTTTTTVAEHSDIQTQQKQQPTKQLSKLIAAVSVSISVSAPGLPVVSVKSNPIETSKIEETEIELGSDSSSSTSSGNDRCLDSISSTSAMPPIPSHFLPSLRKVLTE